MMISRALILLACLLFTAGLRAAEQNSKPSWPRFRGPDGSGVAVDAKAPPVSFKPDNLLWKTRIPGGVSSPCITGNLIFITGYTPGEKPDTDQGTLELICLQRGKGNILWRKPIPATSIEHVHHTNSPANASPVTDGESVYVYFASSGLFCFDRAGNLVWSEKRPVLKSQYGSGTSPVLAGDALILNMDLDKKTSLVAFDKTTGDRLWKHEYQSAGGNSWSTPVVHRDEIIVHRSGEVCAFSVKDGKKRWWMRTATSGESSPIIHDGTIYVACWKHGGEPDLRVEMPSFERLLEQHDKDRNGKLSKAEFPADITPFQRPEILSVEEGQIRLIWFFGRIDKESPGANPGDPAIPKDGEIDSREWAGLLKFVEAFQQDHGLLAIHPDGRDDLTDKALVWRVEKAIAEIPSVIHHDGYIYMIKNGGLLTCVDAKSGKTVYLKRVGAAGAYYASPIIARDRLYLASLKGVLSVIATGPDYQLLGQSNLGEPIKATPACVEGKLYIRAGDHLYAFGR